MENQEIETKVELEKLKKIKIETESRAAADVELIENKIKKIQEDNEQARRSARGQIGKLTDDCIKLEVENGKIRKKTNKLEFVLALSQKEEEQIRGTIQEKSNIMDEIKKFLEETEKLIQIKKQDYLNDQETVSSLV